MTAVMLHGERREFSRFLLDARAVLALGTETVRCRLTDISLGGALVTVPTAALAASEGQRCTLTVHLDLGGSAIRMQGTIAYVGEDGIGVACRDTDLDSFAHLRRLVELNLAEEKLVNRELAALVRQRAR